MVEAQPQRQRQKFTNLFYSEAATEEAVLGTEKVMEQEGQGMEKDMQEGLGTALAGPGVTTRSVDTAAGMLVDNSLGEVDNQQACL